MIRIALCALALGLATSALGGCSEDDTEAPAAPFLDAVASPTMHATQTISGTAEFASTVRIEGGVETVEVIADPYSARFRAEIELNTGEEAVENTISVTATDAAGNESEAAVLSIEWRPTPPPPAPSIDPVTTPTMLPSQVISGSGPPGTTVRIEGGAEPVEAIVDPFTSRFFAEVLFNMDPATGETSVDNNLSITVRDADGLVSAATAVTIVFETPRAEGMTLSLLTQTVSADDGKLTARAQISNTQLDDLSGFDVTFSIEGLADEEDRSAKTDFQGIAEVEFDGLTTAAKEVRVTAVADTNPEASATAAFRVVAGVPNQIAMELHLAGADDALPDPASIQVGDDLEVELVVSDAHGNETGDPVSVATTIPGALVSGFSVSQIERMGGYLVVGAVVGHNVTASIGVTVAAGDPDRVTLTASPNPVVAGEPVTLIADVFDQFGNNTGDTATLASDMDLDSHTDCVENEGFIQANEFRSCHAGEVIITASFAGATDAVLTLFTVPAAPTDLSSFTLTGEAADGVIKAGEDVTYTYQVSDAFGNPVDAPIDVIVNDPGAVVLDDGLSGMGTISGMVRASSVPYTVTALVAGTAIRENRPVTVGIADGQRTIAQALSLSQMAVDDTVMAFAVVRDVFGNIISSPAPTFSITLADGGDATGNFAQANGNEFTINVAEVYKITATFDDAVNPAATADEFILVQNVPDLQPPTVRIKAINGFGVCPDGTLKTNVPGDCVDTNPDIEFGRGDVVVVEVEVDDDRGLSEIAFKAFGSGVSQDDFTLLGAGAHTPGAPLTVDFAFSIGNTAFPGDANVVAQAKDTFGNVANSVVGLLRIDLGLTVNGSRTIETVAGGAALTLTNPRDVAYNPLDGSIYVANRDNQNPSVMRVEGAFLSTVATFGDDPEHLTFDAAGNMFVALDNADEIWRVEPDGTQTLYQENGDPNPPNDPEGLALLDTATPGVGRFIFTGVGDEDCVEVTGGMTYEFDSGGGCAGGGGNCGQASDVCVAYDGSTQDAMDQLELAINANSLLVSAGQGADCEGSGDPCVYLVATTAGSAGLPIALDEPSGNGDILATDVDDGQDGSLLYAADRGGAELIHEFAAPLSPGANTLNTYDLGQQPRGIEVAVRGTPSRLFIYSVDEGSDRLREFDTATGVERTVANDTQDLDAPWDTVMTFNECLLVSNRGSGEIIAIGNIDGPGPATSEVVADGFDRPRGLSLEGSGESANLLVADDGFDIVTRITPTAALGDCF